MVCRLAGNVGLHAGSQEAHDLRSKLLCRVGMTSGQGRADKSDADLGHDLGNTDLLVSQTDCSLDVTMLATSSTSLRSAVDFDACGDDAYNNLTELLTCDRSSLNQNSSSVPDACSLPRIPDGKAP